MYRLGAYNHQLGQTTSSHRSSSSFLTHTPHKALYSAMSVPSRYVHHRFQTQTPASILSPIKKRLNKHRTTTVPTETTTPLRGDQRPQIDDDEIHEYIEEFIPLRARNQPVTVHPIYSINAVDQTQICIPYIDSRFLFLLLLLLLIRHQFNVFLQIFQRFLLYYIYILNISHRHPSYNSSVKTWTNQSFSFYSFYM